MKSSRPSAPIEPLEARIAPATLNVVAGALSYTAGNIFANTLTVSISGANYVFTDSDTITLGAGALAAGFTGDGTNTVTGPDAAVSSLLINLGILDDTLTVNGLNDPLTFEGGTGSDTAILSAGATNAGGAVTINAETVDLNSLGGATVLTLNTDTLSVDGNVSASTSMVIAPLTADRLINLGTENASQLSLAATEIARITAPLLRVGNAAAGSIIVSASLAFGGSSVLSLATGGGVTVNAAAGITVNALAIDADANVTINAGTSDFETLAIAVSDAGADITIIENNGFAIGTVDGISGLTTSGDAGSVITINSGTVTQAADTSVTTPNLLILNTGPVFLLNTTNNVGTLAANTSATINYTDADALDIGTVGGVSGITTTNDAVTLTTLAGDLRVTNGNGTAAPDIAVGSARIQLTAGVVGSDFAIILDANAGLSAQLGMNSNAVELIADRMTLGAPINAGSSRVFIRPFESTTTVALGGADAAGVLGLTDGELDQITASLIFPNVSTSNPVTVTGAISPANTTAVHIFGSSISGTGSFTVADLRLFANGAVNLPGANDVDFLRLEVAAASTFADADGFTFGPATGTDNLGSLGDVLTTLAAGSGTVTITNRALLLSLSGVTPGVGHDQLAIQGALTLGPGARLNPIPSTTLPQDTEFVILANDGTDPVAGTFAAADGSPLPEGAMLPNFSPPAFITYVGGDGNDVAIVTLPALAVTLSADKKTATFRDVDGDLVTVKTTKGAFDGSEFLGLQLTPTTGQLFRLTLDADFTGANITITAKPAPGGDGFINIGRFDAEGVDLGHVRIGGDVSRLLAGTFGGPAGVPGLKSLTVQSVGLYGLGTLGPADLDASGVSVAGALGKITIAGDLRTSLRTLDTDSHLGTVVIGGSVTPGAATGSLIIVGDTGIGSLQIGGDIRNVPGAVVFIGSSAAIGSITVGGSILGLDTASTVRIEAFGQPTAPARGLDVALKSLTVKGSAEFLHIQAGGPFTNADASIGSIAIGGNWVGSSVIAGAYTAGGDGILGTDDDQRAATTTRDNPALLATIGSFTVKGQAFGTFTLTTDMFAVLAERIGKAKVGKRTFAFTPGAPEAFFAAPTVDGAGAENPAFDFILREFGAATPAPDFGPTNLVISPDGRTATFTELDGDLVTIKRSTGGFTPGDFILSAGPVGGAAFTKLTVTAAPGGAPVNVSITARPTAAGGNGFVNLGELASITDLGNITIGGEAASVFITDADPTRPGLARLTVHSIGANSGGGTTSNIVSTGIGAIVVKTDVRLQASNAINSGNGTLGSLAIGGYLAPAADVGGGSTIFSNASIGTIKTAGSVLPSITIRAAESISSITIGGDLIGSEASGLALIRAEGKGPAPARGPDVVLGSLTVKGTIERASIEIGASNADAVIGAISVGRAWLASTAFAGATRGADNLFGTADDTKASGAGVRDEAARFSTIAKILIQGPALGTGAAGDHFGIIAEQIAKAQIGKAKLKLDKGERDTADAFLLAPLGLGTGNGTRDFFLREIIA